MSEIKLEMSEIMLEMSEIKHEIWTKCKMSEIGCTYMSEKVRLVLE